MTIINDFQSLDAFKTTQIPIFLNFNVQLLDFSALRIVCVLVIVLLPGIGMGGRIHTQ